MSVSEREIVGCKVEETVNTSRSFFGSFFCFALVFIYLFVVGLFMTHSRHTCGSGSSQEISVIAKE